ncbi:MULTISPECIES: TetR/AcrR family transcriptional regulator [Lysinibacillus]|uniref:TetR/AcrR family transcriptional regulator n=1 Tax=Lysinibacillus antri TaxID=2498145 RepID=A0A3S0WIL5_9BACI|nr:MULTISPECIES: TetR/AcrR family transcriptional regulator [Lysinibacillus]RUL56882.1 TetR/AcrR family transcriptional regulator [Lysinibacillus antri]TSI08629.1 TetR/AcrR family transcriptional regulator [Lysinibacillus sp. BW-2-10]
MTIEEHRESQRQKRTKKHLQQAFIQLIKEKGYHSISVKDIVELAEYNRSTFYVHFHDKEHLAQDLLSTMLQNLEASVGEPYEKGQHVNTTKLSKPSFHIIQFIYDARNFFELVKYEDTIPGLHTQFPLTILKIYQEQFEFQTIDNIPVDMDYFKRYTAYGFYGIIMDWITNDFHEPRGEFINKIINLARTHIYAFEYKGK